MNCNIGDKITILNSNDGIRNKDVGKTFTVYAIDTEWSDHRYQYKTDDADQSWYVRIPNFKLATNRNGANS